MAETGAGIPPKDIFVIVPAHNEGEVLAATLKPLLQASYSVVVVDDGSKDGTWQILAKMPVYALRHPVNLGQGAALQTGMTFALRKGARFLAHFDADGQHRPQDIAALLEPVANGEADVALGSRFLRSLDEREVPLGRRIILKTAIVVNALLTGLWLSDAHNGLRVLSREAAAQIHLRENGYAHASEIMIQIRHLKLRIAERPVRVHYSRYTRAKGQSLWNAFNIVIDLLLRRVFK
ncbi:MAG: glycosyltransferase family 2 protein [Candidatus Omnitrophota bacterium]|jgi:glycosyltransferase involved in cell wall biosynthesis